MNTSLRGADLPLAPGPLLVRDQDVACEHLELLFDLDDPRGGLELRLVEQLRGILGAFQGSPGSKE